ncbi:M24 family metallopeptidase [Sphingomonas sp.]|uniref:M24 family metallopeptidase n=1 Tax=Sphingomonas sp. TaxID=28214 RepID=UPI003B3B3E07
MIHASSSARFSAGRSDLVTRRALLGGAVMLAGASAMAPLLAQGTGGVGKAPPAITRGEYEARIAKAQRLMRAAGLTALLVEAGSSLVYFTGVEWWRSERLTGAVIPASGAIAIVTPHFEEPSIRETLAIPAEVRVWQEDEDALALVAGVLRDRKAAAGPIGIEETVRYFAVDGLAKALPHATIRSGAGVVRACRLIKSPAEIALMQHANDITIAAYRDTYAKVEKGMTGADIGKIMAAAQLAHGADEADGGLVLLDEASAYPHGSHVRHEVREGMVVLMDTGCKVKGYSSDISRTFVHGEPTAAQRTMWTQMHRGQEIAFATAQVGTPAGKVDDAVRAYYESLGYGPGYKLPGTSHRTGHGIGLDGHEPVNLVHGETTPLAPGMCFSNEPGLYRPGAFGIRLEDCFHMTESGPKWFSVPPPSIDRPFG